MTVPEYDEECNCDMCTTLRNGRIKQNEDRIKKEIDRVTNEQELSKRKVSTGTDLLRDYFR